MSVISTSLIVLVAFVLGLLICFMFFRYVQMGKELHVMKERIERTRDDLMLVLQSGDMNVWVHDMATDTIRFLKRDLSTTEPVSLDEHFKLKHPDDRAVCAAAMKELLTKAKTSTSIIYHYVDSSVPGGYRIVESFVTAKWQGDKVVEMIGVEHDVTNEKLMMKGLQQAQEKSNMAIKASGIISWELNIHTGEVTVTNVYGRMGSRTMPLNECLKYVYEEDRNRVSMALYELLMNARSDAFHFDLRLMIPGREGLQYCTLYGNGLEVDTSRHPSSYIGFITNETPYMEMNKKLEWANRYTQLILENVNCGLLYVDTDFNVLWDNTKYVFPGFNAFEGFCKRGWVGNCLIEQGKKVRCVECPVDKCLRQKELVTMEHTINENHVVEVQLIPVLDNDQVVGAVCRIDDITARNRTIHELEEARKKAEASSKLKTTFLANLGHEIRTPLNAITGFTSILNDVDEKERESYIHIINENSQNLTKLIDNLLELSDFESGEMNFLHEPVYLPTLIESLLDNYSACSSEQVKIVYEYQEGLTVLSDATRLEEVMGNFLSNALKYTPSGTITVGYENLGAQGIKLFVRDTGVGISEEHRPRMFHRFEKFGSLLQGNGLGLAISKSIVENLGGTIGYDSQVGVGSTFWVILPLEND